MTVRRQRKVASACFTQNADHREKDGDVERPVRAPSQGRSRTVAAAKPKAAGGSTLDRDGQRRVCLTVQPPAGGAGRASTRAGQARTCRPTPARSGGRGNSAPISTRRHDRRPGPPLAMLITPTCSLTSHPDSLFPSMPFFSRGRIGNRVAPGPEYLIMSSTAQGKKDARLSAVR